MDDILYNSDGDPNLLYTNWNDDRSWLNANWDKPGNQWNRENGFVFLASQLSSYSPNYLGEFCFVSCPFQPPSILPISSIFLEREIYFFVSNDFVSHKIIKNIFKVSVFLIASLTQGCFSRGDKKLAIAIASIISENNLSIFKPREYL